MIRKMLLPLVLLTASDVLAQSPSETGGGVVGIGDGPVLEADLDPAGFGIGSTDAALGDGSSATFTLNIDLSGTDFDLNFDATDACLGMGANDVLCWSNDGTDSLVVVKESSAQTGDALCIQTSGGSSRFCFDANSILMSIGTSVSTYMQEYLADLYISSDDQMFFTASNNGAPAYRFSARAGGETILELHDVMVAVNALKITNSATGNDVSVEVIGSDTNPGIKLVPKGQGRIIVDGPSRHECQSTAPTGGVKGEIYCDSDLTVPCWHNGTNWVQMDDFSTVCS